MDESVRLACAQLTGSIVQDLAGQLSETATKLRAFLDVYPGAPTDIVREKLAELAPDKLHNLARQSFLRPERLKVKRYLFAWPRYTLPTQCNEHVVVDTSRLACNMSQNLLIAACRSF